MNFEFQISPKDTLAWGVFSDVSTKQHLNLNGNIFCHFIAVDAIKILCQISGLRDPNEYSERIVSFYAVEKQTLDNCILFFLFFL